MKKILIILLSFITIGLNAQTWVLIKKINSGGAFACGVISLDYQNNRTNVNIIGYDDYATILLNGSPNSMTTIGVNGIYTTKLSVLTALLSYPKFSGAYLRVLETLPFNTDTIVQVIPPLIVQRDSIRIDTIKRIGRVGANDYIDYSLYHKAILTITKHCLKNEYADEKVSFLIDNTDTIPGTNCATYDYIKGVQKYYGWKDSTAIKNFIPYIPKESFDNR